MVEKGDGEMNINCTGMRCPMQHDKIDPSTCIAFSYCEYATPPKTNADYIRAMSDEELSVWIGNVFGGSKSEWLDWLKNQKGESI